jgi:hypothetical protein
MLFSPSLSASIQGQPKSKNEAPKSEAQEPEAKSQDPHSTLFIRLASSMKEYTEGLNLIAEC